MCSLDARATAHRPLKRAKRPTPVAKGNIEEFENPVNLGKSRKTQLQFWKNEASRLKKKAASRQTINLVTRKIKLTLSKSSFPVGYVKPRFKNQVQVWMCFWEQKNWQGEYNSSNRLFISN